MSSRGHRIFLIHFDIYTQINHFVNPALNNQYLSPVTHSRIIGEGPESAGSRFTPTNRHIWGTFWVCDYTVQEEPRWSYEFPVVLTPNHHKSPPDSTRFNYEYAQNVPRTPRMRPLKFESCVSVPNQLRLDKNVPRLRPDVADGAANRAESSPDSAPTLPRLTPESSACIFLHRGPSEPRLSADLPDSATNHPERAPVSPDSATEEPRIMPNHLDSA